MIGYVLLLAFASLLCYTIGDAVIKRGIVAFNNYPVTLFLMLIGITPLVVANLLIPSPPISNYVLMLLVFAGLFGFLGNVLVYNALKVEEVTKTWSLTSIYSAALVLLGIFALDESITSVTAIGIALIFIAIVFLIGNNLSKFSRRFMPAILGNAAWAMFFIFVIYAMDISGSVMGPFLFARIFSLIFMAFYLAMSPQLITKKKAAARHAAGNVSAAVIVILTGILLGMAQVFLAFVIYAKDVALGGSVLALESLFMAMIGYFAYKNALTRYQLVGIIISVIGAVLLGIGVI
jgi:drug/metabolite transporter (DMT)-like permease